MARYLCQLCDNVVTYGENHPCFFYKNDDNVYSLPEYWKDSSRHLSQADQQNKKENPELKNLSLFQNNAEVKSLFSKGNWFRTFAESTDNAQTRNPCEISYFNLISDVEVIEVEGNENAFVTVSSENVESDYRPETDQRETFEKTIIVIGPSDVDLQTQRLLDVSDLMHATAEEECKMPVEDNKRQTLNNDKNNFIFSLECGMNKIISDGNKVSKTANLIVNLDLPSGNKESKNGKQVSECVNHEHISPEVHSQVESKKTKVATYVKEPHSTIKDDNAVAGPSGICHRKKKFPKTCSRKDNLKPNYQTRTGDEPFMCNICKKKFSKKSDLERHYRTHTGEKPYECDICEKKFSSKSYLIIHYRLHTGEKPYVCDICGKKFSQKPHLLTHYRVHTGEKPYVCEFCNKGFAKKSNLKIHVRTHTGEKPYKCPSCEKSFMNSRDFKRHHKRKHE
ncbi:zinc finger protein 182-like [Argiope bruennichi]|uniref:zinc finger protein 182-like n=1 Tax=Argiope bruennichi TaxID=94029 RepID=UPI0024951417|nr:zinc finger protein 182-like [Argiope bruennichi]